jgi:hypothetical protein
MIVPNLKIYYGIFKQLINLRNSNNKTKGLMTYNENDIQKKFQRKRLGMLTTIHYDIQERRQVVQASWLKHLQCGHQLTSKYQSFMLLPNNNIRQLESLCHI